MTPVVRFADVEALTKAWALSSTVAPLLTRTDGGVSIYLSMPASAPIPALTMTRVGGAPRRRQDLPVDYARMRFSCWGRSRQQAGDIARALVAELESLGHTDGFDNGDARLTAAEVINLFWLPDPESDTARYVVDALIAAVST